MNPGQSDTGHYEDKRPKRSAGKGWTVAVSASREFYDPDMMEPGQCLPLSPLEKAPVSIPLNTIHEHTSRVPPVNPVPGKVRQSGDHRPVVKRAVIPHDSVERRGAQKTLAPKHQRRKVQRLNAKGNSTRNEAKYRKQAMR